MSVYVSTPSFTFIMLSFHRPQLVNPQKNPKCHKQLEIFGSIISVVGKTTVEIIELFKCTQKVP